MPDVHPVTQRLIDFLTASPTPFHAVAEARRLLEAKGFQQVSRTEANQAMPAGTKGFVDAGGSLFAFRVGQAPLTEAGWRIVAAHTDSPNLRIKPQPLVRDHGYIRLGLEVYGGVQLATWVDRDLGVAGQVYLRDDGPTGMRAVLVDLRRPLCRIPTLAIHLNRQVNEKGLLLNAQTQLPAMLALDGGNDDDPLRELLAAELDVEPDQILTWDLQLYDLMPPSIGGARGEFVHSGRLDNLGSSHAGLEALLASLQGAPVRSTSVLALFDHEEVGSQTARGANSQAIEDVLRLTLSSDSASDFRRAVSNSWLVSADMAHAVHPAYADKHDREHMPKLNAGPVVKQNASKRYATEAETSARWMLVCEAADVPLQWFVNRSDLACGSTVGPMLSARLSMPSIDVGNPMLSMHSAREQAGAHDHPLMARAMEAFYRS